MATNTFKIPSKSTSRGSFFGWLETAIPKFLRIDESLTQVIHVRFMPQILFISVLCIIYIGSRHYAEKKIRAISKLETQVEDLRADFTTLKAAYMKDSKQTEVAKKVRSLGLVESKEPPFKIIVEDE